MAQPNLVKVLDVCPVAPTPPYSPNSTAQPTLPLTFFDVFWLRFPPPSCLFFYELPYSKPTLIDTVLPKLKRSLSATLRHYLPLAGTLTWPSNAEKPIFQYNEGDTISLTVAESDEASFHHLSGANFREAKRFHPFLPSLMASQTKASILALQVTIFPNAGFSIGYAVHHAMFDGKSAAMFMHSWASICRRGEDGEVSTLPPRLTPLYDRTIIKDPSEIAKAYLNYWLANNGPNNRSLKIWDVKSQPDAMLGTFHLTKSNIESIKKWVDAKCQERPAFLPSNFAVTSAYTWVCLVKARKLTTEKVQLVINVDCRARLEPPAPSTYFGNCVSGCTVEMDKKKLMEEDGVARAVKAIGEAIRGLDDGVLNGAEEFISDLHCIQEEGLYSIAGSPRTENYETDFGWGRPRKVELVSIEKTGAFCLSDSRDGDGGVEIGVVLNKHEIEAFTSLFASGLGYHCLKTAKNSLNNKQLYKKASRI